MRFSLRQLMLVTALLAVALLIMLTRLDRAHDQRRASYLRRRWRVNALIINEALEAYRQQNGQYPVDVIGPDGRPWHSWRVLILPYTRGGRHVYDEYDFNEPWDGPNNIRLLHRRPRCFDALGSSECTGIVLVTMKAEKAEVPRPAGQLMEASRLEILWTKPADMTFRDFEQQVNHGLVGRTSFRHLVPR